MKRLLRVPLVPARPRPGFVGWVKLLRHFWLPPVLAFWALSADLPLLLAVAGYLAVSWWWFRRADLVMAFKYDRDGMRRQYVADEPKRRAKQLRRVWWAAVEAADLVIVRTNRNGEPVTDHPHLSMVFDTPTGVRFLFRPLPGQSVEQWQHAASRLVSTHLVSGALSGSVSQAAEYPGWLWLELSTTADALASVAASVAAERSPVLLGGWDPDAIPLGRDAAGQLVTVSILRAPHALIAGSTGSGKSVLQRALVVALSVSGFEMRGCDPKRVELGGELAKFFTHLARTPEDSVALLNATFDEMQRRYELLEAENLTNAPADWQRIGLVVDELALLRSILTGDRDKAKAFDGRLGELLAAGRAAGIHLILTTQRPDADSIPSTARANVPLRLVGKVPDRNSAKIALGVPMSDTDLPMDPSEFPARPGTFAVVGQGPPRVFQAFDLPLEAL